MSQLKTIASMKVVVDSEAKSAKSSAGTAAAIPAAVIEEVKAALESLRHNAANGNSNDS